MKPACLALVALVLTGCSAASDSASSAASSVASAAASAAAPVASAAASAAAPAAPKPAAPAGLEDGSFSSTTPKLADSLGTFGGTARVTNKSGKDITGATFTYTIFKGDKEVGTAAGVVNEIAAGKTNTVQLISTDKFAAGPHRVEFQVDAEF